MPADGSMASTEKTGYIWYIELKGSHNVPRSGPCRAAPYSVPRPVKVRHAGRSPQSPCLGEGAVSLHESVQPREHG